MVGKLDGRIIVVTGASRGIGYFSALEMVREGAHVIAVSRTVGGLEELDDAATELSGSVTLVPMNVTDYEAIDRLGGVISQRWGKLDGFFGNAAAVGSLSPLGHIEPKSFDNVFATNVTANWRFIRSFDLLFRASEQARILLVSAGITRNVKAFAGPYTMSKAALEALAKTYAAECANTEIKVNILDPGIVRTAMRAQVMPGEDPLSVTHPRELAPKIVKLLSDDVSESGSIFDINSDGFIK